MKTLMLMRHAKSSWGDESLPDFERPLNERGTRDALRIGRELLARNSVPDVIISSTAVRAAQTCSLVCEGLEIDARNAVQFEKQLYGADSDRILETVNQISDECSRALIIGHNPGLQDLVTRLIGTWLPEGMKTATVACIKFDVSEWSQASDGGGTLEWVLYPAQLNA